MNRIEAIGLWIGFLLIENIYINLYWLKIDLVSILLIIASIITFILLSINVGMKETWFGDK